MQIPDVLVHRQDRVHHLGEPVEIELLLGGHLLGAEADHVMLEERRVRLIGGMASVLCVRFTLKVEFLWYNVIGCVGVLLVGGLVSAFERRRA